MEEIKDIVEILELVKEELENNNENTSAILDLQDLKALKNLYDLYIQEKEKNKEYEETLDIFDERTYRKKYLEERRKEEPSLLYPDADEIYQKYYEEKEKNKELEKNRKASVNFAKIVERDYIDKDKIKEALNISLDEETNIDLVSLIKTIFDECERLEDIEDRKVQIEYENVFNKGSNSIKDKIKEMKEFYINEYKNKNITLIPLENIIKNINVLLEESINNE